MMTLLLGEKMMLSSLVFLTLLTGLEAEGLREAPGALRFLHHDTHHKEKSISINC